MTGALVAGTMPRPLLHFTPRRNWMNDPNGLVHHRGVWHLFFQYNPHGSDWGNMSWGHATSPDLEHWTEQPVALPHRDGEQIYSGSVVSSGGTLTALYTSAYDDGHQAQSRATSEDDGLTWILDPANPVLDRGTTAFRDPKVVRVGDAWVLVAVEAEERRVLFHTSRDLRSWRETGSFGPIGEEGVVWECPDLILLALDDDPLDLRWVLTLSTNPVDDRADPEGSSMAYAVGSFDGLTFTSDAQELTRLDHGRDYYAGVTFDSAPGGEAVMLGWMSNWRYAHAVPSSPWRGAMSLPRTLSLRSIAGSPRLIQRPPGFVVDRLAEVPAIGVEEPTALALSAHCLLELEWDPARTGPLLLRLRGEDAFAEIAHDDAVLRITRGGPAADAVHPDFSGTSAVPLDSSGPVRLLVCLDGPLLEVFADGGAATASQLVALGAGPLEATLAAERGTVLVRAVDIASD